MAASSRRSDQVAEVIRQVVAEALLGEVRDPRVALTTVTRVRVTQDLSQARVSVVVHGGDEERDRALEGLASAAGFLRGRVARSLATRTTPELVFEIDRGVEHAARIDAILGRLRREEEA
jgi:ribosome-binding factor A